MGASTQAIRAGRAFVELFVDDTKLVQGLRRSEARVKAFGAKLQGIGKRMAGIGAAVLAPLTGAAAVFSAAGDKIHKMALRTGMSAEALSQLMFAAEQSGSSIESVEKGVRRMSKVVIDADRGLVAAARSLESLGLSAQTLRGMAPEDQFALISDRLGQIRDDTLQAALAQEIFGRAGSELIPFFEEGATGIARLRKEADLLGLTITAEDAANAAALADAWNAMKKAGLAAVFQVGSAIAGDLTKAARAVSKFATMVSTWIKQNKEVVVTIAKVAATVTAVGGAITALGITVGAAGTMLGVMASAISATLSPLGLATVALGAFLHYTGQSGKAVEWLGEKFRGLADFAKRSFQGISDALAAGDMTKASEILWLSLDVAWQTGAAKLVEIWNNFKVAIVETFAGAMIAIQRMWSATWGSMAKSLLDFAAEDGPLGAIARKMIGVDMRVEDARNQQVERERREIAKKNLEGTIGGLQRELSVAKEGGDTEAVKRLQTMIGRFQADLSKLSGPLDSATEQAKQIVSGIVQKSRDASGEHWGGAAGDARQNANAAIAESQAQLDAARKEWGIALAEAKAGKDAKKLEVTLFKAPLEEVSSDAQQQLGQTVRGIGISSTFNAMAAMRGMGGQSPVERIEQKMTPMARDLSRLVQEAKKGGITFG